MKAPFTPDRLQAIKQLVADRFLLHARVLDAPDRTAKVSRARHVAMFLIRETLTEVEPFTNAVKPMSNRRIAEAFRRGDHETARHAFKVISALARRDAAFASTITALRGKISRAFSIRDSAPLPK